MTNSPYSEREAGGLCERLTNAAFECESLICAEQDGHTIYPDPMPIRDALEEASSIIRAQAAELERLRGVLDALKLILPLAKGYRPEGQTDTARRTCHSWIEAAEEAVAVAEGREP